MTLNGQPTRSIWEHPERSGVAQIIDQRALPHEIHFFDLDSVDTVAYAIREMVTRGAPLIGLVGAWGMYIAMLEASSKALDFKRKAEEVAEILKGTRPTAVNLAWAVDQQLEAIRAADDALQAEGIAYRNALLLIDEDVDTCRRIGEHGLQLFQRLQNQHPDRPLRVLTHCNAGWLATADFGTATAPIYLARQAGMHIHVWVDETRPRNQGAGLTAWELGQEGVSHQVIVDNAGGHLMQEGMVDVVIVGTDRIARNGDVANKIGTYLKALAAHANGIPVYVAAPRSSIDKQLSRGSDIPIEYRSAEEVTHIWGMNDQGKLQRVQVTPPGTQALNPGFDITPAPLVTALITESGVFKASEAGIASLMAAT